MVLRLIVLLLLAGTMAHALPVSIRTNNPGAQWPGPVATQWGATGSIDLFDGNKIAVFENPIYGAAAQFALLRKSYLGLTIDQAISKWIGGRDATEYARRVARAAGVSTGEALTEDLLAGPGGIELAKAMAHWEAGMDFPLTDEQWKHAQEMVFGRVCLMTSDGFRWP